MGSFSSPLFYLLEASSKNEKTMVQPSFLDSTTPNGGEGSDNAATGPNLVLKLWRTRGVKHGRKQGAGYTGILSRVLTWGLSL
ncbi:hypothetical protein V6Z11_A08G207300 [Gossypium hirsutum]